MSDADSTTNEGGTNGDGTCAIDDTTLNQGFDILASQRCRYAIVALRTADDTSIPLATLADAIVAADPDATDADRVQADLHHKTLPRLREAALIDYDPRTHMVRYYGDDFVDSVLDTL